LDNYAETLTGSSYNVTCFYFVAVAIVSDAEKRAFGQLAGFFKNRLKPDRRKFQGVFKELADRKFAENPIL
jgi:hypothetical protein